MEDFDFEIFRKNQFNDLKHIGLEDICLNLQLKQNSRCKRSKQNSNVQRPSEIEKHISENIKVVRVKIRLFILNFLKVTSCKNDKQSNECRILIFDTFEHMINRIDQLTENILQRQ
jgi:hypothetical protein